MLREITMKLSSYLAGASLARIAPQRRPARVPPRPVRHSAGYRLSREAGIAPSPSRRRRPRSPSLPAAKGYGEASMARRGAAHCPEGTSVVFGDGVDRELPVNWQGGRP